MPAWAKPIDDYGRRKWKKDNLRDKKGEYGGNIVFGLIFLWIVNKVPDWNLPFIRDNYNVVLWVLNLNLIVNIACGILLMVLSARPLRYLWRMIIEAAGFVTNIVLFYVYPFDFSHIHDFTWLDKVIPILLIIGMVVSALKVLANIWKMIFWGSK